MKKLFYPFPGMICILFFNATALANIFRSSETFFFDSRPLTVLLDGTAIGITCFLTIVFLTRHYTMLRKKVDVFAQAGTFTVVVSNLRRGW